MSNLYPKIPGLYKRDPKTHKVIREFTSPELEALYDQPIWIAREKVDGTNLRVIWDGHRVSWAGRTDNATFSEPQTEFLAKTFNNDASETLFETTFQDTPAVLYGELYGPGIQGGGKYSEKLDFALFDVRIGDIWLREDSVEDISIALGLRRVPALDYGVTLAEIEEKVASNPRSWIAVLNGKYEPTEPEGYVAVTQFGLLDRRGQRLIVKIKARDIKDIDDV